MRTERSLPTSSEPVPLTTDFAESVALTEPQLVDITIGRRDVEEPNLEGLHLTSGVPSGATSLFSSKLLGEWDRPSHFLDSAIIKLNYVPNMVSPHQGQVPRNELRNSTGHTAKPRPPVRMLRTYKRSTSQYMAGSSAEGSGSSVAFPQDRS